METEMIKIYDDNRNPIGEATREDVHKKGFWHETFHCWFTIKDDSKDYLIFQLRSETKKDYPNLLDITAAGHILAHESIEDGIREVKEEIGIDVSNDQLISLGVIDYCVIKDDFIDKELANAYLYKYGNHTFEDFKLQPEEVSGIVKVEFTHFYDLLLGNLDEVRIQGFEIDKDGAKVPINIMVDKSRFVPHENSYYESILHSIKQHL